MITHRSSNLTEDDQTLRSLLLNIRCQRPIDQLCLESESTHFSLLLLLTFVFLTYGTEIIHRCRPLSDILFRLLAVSVIAKMFIPHLSTHANTQAMEVSMLAKLQHQIHSPMGISDTEPAALPIRNVWISANDGRRCVSRCQHSHIMS